MVGWTRQPRSSQTPPGCPVAGRDPRRRPPTEGPLRSMSLSGVERAGTMITQRRRCRRRRGVGRAVSRPCSTVFPQEATEPRLVERALSSLDCCHQRWVDGRIRPPCLRSGRRPQQAVVPSVRHRRPRSSPRVALSMVYPRARRAHPAESHDAPDSATCRVAGHHAPASTSRVTQDPRPTRQQAPSRTFGMTLAPLPT